MGIGKGGVEKGGMKGVGMGRGGIRFGFWLVGNGRMGGRGGSKGMKRW